MYEELSTTVTEQPQQAVAGTKRAANHELRNWNSEMFACMDDVPGCLYCTFCFCCFSCSLASKMKECSLGPFCLGWPFYAAMRAKLRGERKIKGSVLSDVMCTLFCTPCTAHQMYRELETAN